MSVRSWRVVAAAVLAVLAGAVPADAAQVGLSPQPTTCGPDGCSSPPPLLTYTADPGEANRLGVAMEGGNLVFRDAGAAIRTQAPCRSDAPGVAVCPPQGGVRVDLGDGNDEVTLSVAAVATGGHGDDVLQGDGHDQDLDGGGGRDRLNAGPGNDSLADGDRVAGAFDSDVLDGGEDVDVLRYTDRAGRVFVDLRSATAPDGDVISGFEQLEGGAGGDVLIGSDRPDVIFGNGGEDDIRGSGGDDRLDGGDGNDAVHGGDGNDQLDGGAGTDRLYGDAGADRLRESGDRSRLDGGSDSDEIYMGPGARARCGAGRDWVAGADSPNATAPPLGPGCELHAYNLGDYRLLFHGRWRVTRSDVGLGIAVPRGLTVAFELRGSIRGRSVRIGRSRAYAGGSPRRARIALGRSAMRRLRSASRLVTVMRVSVPGTAPSRARFRVVLRR